MVEKFHERSYTLEHTASSAPRTAITERVDVTADRRHTTGDATSGRGRAAAPTDGRSVTLGHNEWIIQAASG